MMKYEIHIASLHHKIVCIVLMIVIVLFLRYYLHVGEIISARDFLVEPQQDVILKS